jgi:hypothetical protein
VDFDVLNDRVEFERQLDSIGTTLTEKTEAVRIQEEIESFVRQSSPDVRLESAKQQLLDLLTTIRNAENTQFASTAEATAAKEQLLRRVNNKCREVSDSTKVWTELKRNGRAALTSTLQSRFDLLWGICASKGLIINPSGELESMLVDYGIPSTTDKRAWITQALQLIGNLEIDDTKYPWRLVAEIHKQLFGE